MAIEGLEKLKKKKSDKKIKNDRMNYDPQMFPCKKIVFDGLSNLCWFRIFRTLRSIDVGNVDSRIES